ncbi:hypothetical protein ACHAQJ_007575 [Trichoderma viride]
MRQGGEFWQCTSRIKGQITLMESCEQTLDNSYGSKQRRRLEALAGNGSGGKPSGIAVKIVAVWAVGRAPGQ